MLTLFRRSGAFTVSRACRWKTGHDRYICIPNEHWGTSPAGLSGLVAYQGADMFQIEDYIGAGVQLLQQLAQVISILIIGMGIIVSLYHLFRPLRLPDMDLYNRVRFDFSGYLVMALEFELASDILGTLISPSWDQLGRLAVIAAIRTFLSYFLQREIRTEKDRAVESPQAES
jgi:uncharacterized membrane protein